MDYIHDLELRRAADLEDRLSQYDETVMICCHNGDVPEVTGFEGFRPTTVQEFCAIKPGQIAFIDDEHEKLAECIGSYADIFGYNLVTLTDVPGVKTAEMAARHLGVLRKVSLMRLLTDIADMRVVEENRSKSERDSSNAHKQDAQLRNKRGEIRLLADFDRGFNEGEEVAEPEGADQ